jgi:hypothetical protein
MIIGYGNFALAFAISSTGGGSAFLTSSAALTDARTGSSCSMSWTAGAQTTSSTVTLTVTITSPLDTTAPIGCVGVANVVGLPVGTKVVVNGVTQRLVASERGELGALWFPNITGNSTTITFYNDVNGTASITAGATFSVGEIFIGRAMTLPTLTNASGQPLAEIVDPTQFNRSAGGQLWQTMRKPYRQRTVQMGYFTTAEALGGQTSDLVSGANPAGVIDLQTLRGYLATAPVCLICDPPSAGRGAGTVTGGLRYDQTFMQTNWMLGRPADVGQIVMDQAPFWSWTLKVMEAT